MDYGIQLGRRFRALKLWLVLEHYGLERLRNVIRLPGTSVNGCEHGSAILR